MFPTPLQSVFSDAFSVHDLDTIPKVACGTRYVDTVDGRVFRYCLAAGTLYPGFGAAFSVGVHHAYEAVHAAAAAGDTTILIDQASVTVDEFAGGYIIMGHNASATSQTRRVVSNTATSTAAASHVIVTLDRPLAVALTTGEGYEIFANPYASMNAPGTTAENETFGGIPAAVATSGKYFWLQTWGPCFCVPGGADATPGYGPNAREVFFVGDGSVNTGDVLTYAGKAYQRAGVIIDKGVSGSVAPLVMLQICP